MIATFIGWLKMLFAYWAGERSQAATDKTQAIEADNAVAQNITVAEASAPRDNAELVDRLRRAGL